MLKKISNFIPIVFFSLIPTLLIWLPFYLRLPSFWKIPLPQDGMATIVSNYDGPLYIVVAKTFYNAQEIKDNFSFNLPVEYYAAHFPLFPALIRASSFALGFPYAMLFVTLISSMLCLFFFYKFIRVYCKKEDAYFLTFLFSIFPARWLVVRSVGSPEPLFVASIIASIYYFQKKKYWLAGIWGAVAQITKSPAILLFLAYFGAITFSKIKILMTQDFEKWAKTIELKAYPIFLIPISLLGVFVLYGKVFNDFFAYFHSGDNIHLFFPPFQIFNYAAPWVNTHWLEEIIFIYLITTFGLIQLIKQGKNVLAWFVGVFLAMLFFVSHRDLMRYALPIVPFLYVSYMDILTKKEYKIAFLEIIIPIYLFSLAFISKNVMPISDWSPLL